MQLNKEAVDINHQLNIGLRHHQDGQLDKAESQYRSILDIQPAQPEALHLLGVLVHQRGETDMAEELVRKAICLSANNPFFYCSLGDIASDCKKYDTAVRNYQKALSLKPDLVEALFNLGNVLQARGQLEKAIENYQKALELKPNLPQAHNNLASAYQRQGNLDRARAHYDSTLDLMPDFPDVYFKLGNIYLEQQKYEAAIEHFQKAVVLRPHWAEPFNNLGSVFQAQGISEKAISCYRKAIEIKPDYAQPFYNLAGIYYEQKKYDQTINCLQKAIEIDSNLPDTYLLLANTMKKNGAMAEAVSNYEKALALKPDHAVTWNNLGRTLRDMDDLNRAIACYQRALDLKPDYAEAFFNMGHAHQAQNEMDKALDCFQKAFDLQPHHVELINDIGLIYYAQNKFTEAVAWFQKAVRIDSANHNIHNNLGAAYHKLGKLAQAIDCYQTTVQLIPSDADAYNNMAVAHKDRCEIPEAIEAHRKALAHNPNYHSAHSNLLLAMHYHCDCDNHSIFSESQNWWQQHGAPVAGRNIHCNHPDPGRRLKVGYVSADFRRHSVSYFFLPLLASHDRKNVNVFCYSGVSYPDHMTEKIRNLADHWRSIVGMSPETVAAQIEKDGIDILVDLSGHTAGHRLLAFARKPAPIQVTWLGYPNSTGMPVMDYRLSDAIADPPGDSDCHHSETVIRLTDGFLCYLPPETTPQVNDLPALRTGRITFGSFNTLPKVNSRVIGLWSEILMKVAGSRLFLKCKQLADESTRLSFLDKFSQHGISSDRITLLPQTPTTQEHLALYNDIDIGLDPFPYNGTTTTCEALWMGVPVVTLKGERHSSRVGASILTRLDLAELIVESLQAYVDKAVALSVDLPRLGRIRNEMRRRMTNSALCDANGFAEQVETSYRIMWRKWCEQNRKSHSNKQAESFNSKAGIPASDSKISETNICFENSAADHIVCENEAAPTMAEALSYLHTGKIDQAEEVCAKILELNPDHADAMHIRGVVASRTEDTDRAIDLIQKAIQLNPVNPLFYCSLADVQQAVLKFDEALSSYKAALSLRPDLVEALFNMGNTYHRSGNFEKAAGCFQKVIELKPDFADAHNNLGTAFEDSGRLKDAIDCYQKAIQSNPEFAVAYFNMGNVLIDKNEYSAAISYFQKAVSLRPDHAAAYNSIGRAHHALGQLEEALNWYQKALEIDPEYSFAINNIGKIYEDQGLFDTACTWYQKAMDRDPDLAEAHFNCALIHLRQGDYAKGWRGYEWRFQRKTWSQTYPHDLEIPRWRGEDFTGKTLLVHCEQGFGDTLQFVRYLPMVKIRGGMVVFEAPKELMGLLRRFSGIDHIVEYSAKAKPVGNFDGYVPLLSLAGIFDTHLNTIPQDVPYISADPDKLAYWGQRICRPGPKIGLVWSGKSTDPKRSCDLKHWVSILETAGANFYGLQKGKAANQIDELPQGPAAINLGPDFKDFSDTAAAIENLDLIISIDTSVAHLAGAMGKPVWLLLPFVADWRWMQDKDDSPWYPTMRLFRQSKPGDWDSVCQQVALELKALAAKH